MTRQTRDQREQVRRHQPRLPEISTVAIPIALLLLATLAGCASSDSSTTERQAGGPIPTEGQDSDNPSDEDEAATERCPSSDPQVNEACSTRFPPLSQTLAEQVDSGAMSQEEADAAIGLERCVGIDPDTAYTLEERISVMQMNSPDDFERCAEMYPDAATAP